MKNAVGEWEKRQWQKWKTDSAMNSNWGLGIISVWGGRPRIQMSGSNGQLLAAVRLMATREEVGAKAGENSSCLMCGLVEESGIMHLVAMCEEWAGERRSALGPGSKKWSRRKKWIGLTNGKSISMHFLREVASRYADKTGNALIPWVGRLGTRVEEGITGMSLLVQSVAEWVSRNEECSDS